MSEMVRLLAEITGLPAPWFAIPHPLLHAMGRVNEWLSDHVTHREPLRAVRGEAARRRQPALRFGKARRELGFEARPAREVLIDAVRWFVSEGFCPPATAREDRAPAGASASADTARTSGKEDA